MTKHEILRLLSENRHAIGEYQVKRLALFGSFVRDEATTDSDVDLLVEFVPAHKTFDNFMGLALFLEDLLDRRVELLTLESLSPHIGPRILREAEYADLAA
ncbi:MAG TPA: nucleotidyltransferase family protein [Candidatus Latescibacteria bacterium]|nr:nucleotidyltransferase family protein [Candidatus Latescibacterota bacterium]HJP31385.1 nucleotidyltransferase family protein [Candidatus Latescibacterota bacterium]